MGKKYIVELDDNKLAYTAIIIDGVPYIKPLQLLPYTEPDTSEAYQRGYDDAKHECQDCQKIMMGAEQERVDKAYQQGVNDAENRKATCEFCEYTGNDVTDEPCVSCCCGYMKMFRPKKEEIQIGDEVVGTYTGGEETEPFVIIRKIPEIDPTYYFGIYSKSGEFCQGGLKLKKTGRHFREITEVLQKMKEDDG